jgi:hypothetical protein
LWVFFLGFASRSGSGQAFFRGFAAGRDGLAALVGFGGDCFEGFCAGGGGDSFAGFASGGGDAFTGFCGGGGDTFAGACFSASELLLRTVPKTRRVLKTTNIIIISVSKTSRLTLTRK